MSDQFQILIDEIRLNRKAISELNSKVNGLELQLTTVKVKFSSITAVASIVLSTLTSYLYKKFGG